MGGGKVARNRFLSLIVCVLFVVVSLWQVVLGQNIKAKVVNKWVTVTGVAAGTDLKARDEAIAQALRKAVEQACGVFLTAQSKTRDYKAVYDKIFANAVGYVREHKVIKIWKDNKKTFARVRVLVSTQKFQKDWSVIAHTINQENNPRVIVAIVEAVLHRPNSLRYEVTQGGIVQSKIESFFLSKGITLMDRATTEKLSKRDVLLAVIKNDDKAVAAAGAKFKADVVVSGRATAKFGRRIEVSGVTMYQYNATLNIRVVQTDSARVLVSQSYGPITVNSLQRGGAADTALKKLAQKYAPKILAAVVEAWRKRANISRTIHLVIKGMDYEAWKLFKAEVTKLRGVQALRLREITEGIANIDVEYRYDNENLADHLTELKNVKLKVVEITANRIKLKTIKAGDSTD